MFRFVGQSNFFHWVQVEPLFNGDVRDVRTVKAAANEEGLVLVGFEHFDGFGGDFSVGLFFIRALGFHPAKGCAQPAARSEIDHISLIITIAAAWIHEFIPRWSIIESTGADLAGNTVVHARLLLEIVPGAAGCSVQVYLNSPGVGTSWDTAAISLAHDPGAQVAPR